MGYFLIWIPASLAALGFLFLLAHVVEQRARIEWPKRYLNHLIGWLMLVLIWVAMLPFILVGWLVGYRPAFEPPSGHASPEATPSRPTSKP